MTGEVKDIGENKSRGVAAMIANEEWCNPGHICVKVQYTRDTGLHLMSAWLCHILWESWHVIARFSQDLQPLPPNLLLTGVLTCQPDLQLIR